VDTVAGNQYLYDGEGRVCAVANTAVSGLPMMTQYIYDAEGHRVAKGSITSFSCDSTSNGFTATTVYVLGPGGEQLSELTSQSGTWQAAHTNVYAAGQQIATYDADLSGQTTGKLYFHLSDWLGTRRQQTDYAGNPVLNFTGLPYGDGLSTIPVSTASAADATEHHFTGKERDSESGNDYFGARYYASSMGRFLSPDPKIMTARHLTNPQKWNKYAYVINNPLMRFDPDGMDDYVVFRTVTSGTNTKQWAAVEKYITGTKDSQGRQNTFHMVQGDAATTKAYNTAISTADTHVVVVGHVTHPPGDSTNTGIGLNDGQSYGKNGSTSMTMTSSPSGTPGAPPDLNLSFNETISNNVVASSVALFGCNSYDLASEYDTTNFTGVQSGPGGTEFETLDSMASSWLLAGGGQAGDNAANNEILNSNYPVDTGANVQSEQKPQQ